MWYHDVVQTQLAVLTTVSQERRVRLLELQLRHTVITLERNTWHFFITSDMDQNAMTSLASVWGVVSSCEIGMG